ncbi:MAG: 1,4-alpha-glucan branching protein GlgB [Deltaproteobacteria bacterium]|nr:1,4-alpha-glucan branching protein GlgB [Deltaproteobacteria bacterium]
MQTDLDMILNGSHSDPFLILGAHFSEPDPDKVTIRTFQPHAEKVTLLLGKLRLIMPRTDEEGLFEQVLNRDDLPDPDLSPFNYRYEILFHDGVVSRINDPYRFPVLLGEQDQYLFSAGTNYKLYDHLGSHIVEIDTISGCLFRVWAPNARAVSVTGGFNGWDRRIHPMRSLGSTGIWELFIPNLQENEYYKYSITTQQHEILDKIDPFQFYGELRPDTASVIKMLDHHQWNDGLWQERKQSLYPYDKALSIYEVHPGSWRRDPADPDRFLTYRELADSLIPHVKELGFTHIELMPVMEHPLDESWGYQVTGPFSITSRYGTPEEFMYFVDRCHQESLGVILDWVPAHFPKDKHSLGKFDGTSLYEHEDSRRGSHPEWGTFIYNYGRREVSNYLISNVLFWLDKYHIDGIRVDAVASMLYLDYSRNEGAWVPNCYGGRENLEAIEFIRHLNSIVYDIHPNTLLIAEESTSFYGVSKPADQGGLGFGFKWNMGWMNDIIDYFSIDPLYRKYHHNLLTFSIMYAFSENFILPLSHDEVVHGKRSLLDKMPGDIWQKFANLRLLYFTQWMHPGKKLLFMGGEFGQWSEWYCKRSLDWHLLKENELHQQLFTFVAELNAFYTATPSLWENDFSDQGFQWLDLEDRNNSIISYARFDKNRKNHIVCIFNYTPQTFEDYKIALPQNCKYQTVFCSDMEKFGGTGFFSTETCKPEPEPYGQADFHTTLSIPPLGGIVLQPVDKKETSKTDKINEVFLT